MADDVWYYADRGKQQGPVSFKRLQELVQEGTIGPDDLVWKVGLPEWTPAREVENLLPAGADAPPPPPTAPPPLAGDGGGFAQRSKAFFRGAADMASSMPHLRWVAALLEWLKKVISGNLLDGVDRVSKQVGNIAYPVAALLLVLFFCIQAIQANQLNWFFLAILVIIPVAMVLHYTAARFLDAGGRLIAASPSKLHSRTFLQCFGLLAFVGALATLIFGIYGAIQEKSFPAFGISLGLAAILTYVGGAALSPASLNVEVGEEVGAGEEAIGILTFLLKLPLRLVPFLFAVGTVVGSVAGLYILFQLFSEDGFPYFAGMGPMELTTNVLGLGLVPLFVYLYFVLLYLGLDVLRAILQVPGKLDALRGGGETGEAES